MTPCATCWSDAYSRSLADTSKSQTEHYYDLLSERPYPCGTQQAVRSHDIAVELDDEGLPARMLIGRRV